MASARGDIKAYIDCLRQVIHPCGHLLLLHRCLGPSDSSNNVFVQDMENELFKNGFVFDSADENSSNGPKLIAKLNKSPKHPKKVTLVIPENPHSLVDAVRTSFQTCGIECEERTFESSAGLDLDQDTVVLVDFGEPYLHNITEEMFRKFANRFQKFKGSLLWITPNAQVSCKDPNSAMIFGMMRTLRAELRKDITVVEIEDDPPAFPTSSQLLTRLYQDLCYRVKAKNVDPDYEYTIINGAIKVSRIHWVAKGDELSKCAAQVGAHADGLQHFSSDSERPPLRTQFRSDVCYLLVGGLGGLGRVVSTWMVQNGARTIMFLSRSAKEGPETTPFFQELRSQGCEVVTFAGSVNNLSDVEAAMRRATKPIAGIIQMSAIMRVCVQSSFENML